MKLYPIVEGHGEVTAAPVLLRCRIASGFCYAGSTANPEATRDAKGALEEFMPRERGYSETGDQDAMSAVFDMALDRVPHELLAGSLVIFVSLIPFFAVKERGRVLGEEKIGALFFRKTERAFVEGDR